jgi:hypothetical protein
LAIVFLHIDDPPDFAQRQFGQLSDIPDSLSGAHSFSSQRIGSMANIPEHRDARPEQP